VSAEPRYIRDLARFLSQREDLGLDEVFLEGLTREQVLRAAGGARREARQPSGLPSRETVGADPKERGSAELPVPGVAPASEVDLAGFEYSELAVVAESCQRCRLAKGRTRVVFSDGNPRARLMVVGEAPGANEDRTGLPFVGQAGKFLDLLLASVDLSRTDSSTVHLF
jgi:DNA polymerase